MLCAADETCAGEACAMCVTPEANASGQEGPIIVGRGVSER
jgi:hypothetical protein